MGSESPAESVQLRYGTASKKQGMSGCRASRVSAPL